jgi:hypothetical protein
VIDLMDPLYASFKKEIKLTKPELTDEIRTSGVEEKGQESYKIIFLKHYEMDG